MPSRRLAPPLWALATDFGQWAVTTDPIVAKQLAADGHVVHPAVQLSTGRADCPARCPDRRHSHGNRTGLRWAWCTPDAPPYVVLAGGDWHWLEEPDG